MRSYTVQFGLGLISLGRRWGFRPRALPSQEEAFALLSTAIDAGVALFDTAPAYADSEKVAGAFFRALPAEVRDRIILATKFGEHWNAEAGHAYIDHSYDALVRSIDRSTERLGRIDVLQLHKSSVEVLCCHDLWRAFDYAQSVGITVFGASVSDLPTARLTCESDRLTVIQMPYNLSSPHLADVFELAHRHGKQVWTNRPLGMGALVEKRGITPADAYRFVLSQRFTGAILTGTACPRHLTEDLAAFRAAQEI